MKFLLLIFSIAFFAFTSSAQTIVYSGDSVALVLNGYKQGITSWQQSSDRANWSNAQGTSYNDSLIIIATTTLYYRAIVTDCTGSSYYSDTILVPVSCGIITDSRDSKTYKTVVIGTQCWMAQNLNVGIALQQEVQQTNNTIIEKYCYGYDHSNSDSSKCDTFGGLYLWDEMMAYGSDPQGICPTGWHVPTYNEWSELVDALGGTTIAGGKLKDTATHLWQPTNTGATNSSGFSALPSGHRVYNGFGGQGNSAYFWTASEGSPVIYAKSYLLTNGSEATTAQPYKNLSGLSVRCVKD